MNDDAEILVASPEAHVDLLLEEFKAAGALPNGRYDSVFNEEARRMIWPGQSADGRKWDENQPEGKRAMPWNGSSDTRVPCIDGVINDTVDLLTAAFRKAELRATTVNPDTQGIAGGISDYLHWLVHTKHRKALRLEAELAAQFAQEYGLAITHIGWEREIGKRRVNFTLTQLQQLCASVPEFQSVPQMILDPTMDDASAEAVRAIYRMYVVQTMEGKGFYEQELDDQALLDLKPATAKRYVRGLRTEGECDIPMPYVCKNEARVTVCKPFTEVVAARGTLMLQQARAIFWRRWMSDAELESKRQDGWDPAWIEAMKKTKGNTSIWGDPPTTSSQQRRTDGYGTFYQVQGSVTALYEVVYAYVKKVDEDGVTGVYETIVSPHATPEDDTPAEDFCAKHALLGYAHGQYPFVEFKRENLGRGLVESRSVGEIAHTWQDEEKNQRDMLFNRAQWDTMPPVRVPKLGGVDYKLGPGAQVAMSRAQDITAINLNAPPPTLALELVKLLKLQAASYFGTFDQEIHPAKLAIRQEKLGDDFYTFWGEVLLQVFSLTLQYNPQEIVTVTGNQELQKLDPFTVLDTLMLGLDFDIKDLNPDYLMQKLDIIHNKILPADTTGAMDRGGLTAYEARAVDPRLAQRFIQDKNTASQKTFDDVQNNVAKAMLGFEPQYGDASNDPTAPMKMQFLQQIMGSNPKVQQWMQSDERFKAILENYAKNLQMGVMQQQNKQVGRIGVQPLGAQGK
jgi:hypothetical protein